MEDNITQFAHFKRNYMWPTIILLAMFVTSLIMSSIRGTELGFSFIFLGLAAIFPIGNYFSWKKKYVEK